MKFKDEIGEFWVVTKPSGESELLDILFKCDIKSMMLQSRGGLDTDELVAILSDGKAARKLAKELIKNQTKNKK